MKVNDSNAAAINSSGLGHAQRVDEVASKRAQERGRVHNQNEDQVQLSGLAGNLQELTADSPEREAMVERLAAEYRDGRYKADPAETSRAIVSDAVKESQR
jgi:anti-sigma28 factor (negative regulator of flagellin synthesis)